jgi:hypothetical protein
MATIKAYTDLVQSRKLAEILPLETADMWYHPDLSDYPDYVERCSIYNIHCWSLAALLDVLDYPQLSKDKLGSGKEGWMVSAYPNDCRYDSCWHDNPIDACVEMIEKLHERKML